MNVLNLSFLHLPVLNLPVFVLGDLILQGPATWLKLVKQYYRILVVYNDLMWFAHNLTQ